MLPPGLYSPWAAPERGLLPLGARHGLAQLLQALLQPVRRAPSRQTPPLELRADMRLGDGVGDPGREPGVGIGVAYGDHEGIRAPAYVQIAREVVDGTLPHGAGFGHVVGGRRVGCAADCRQPALGQVGRQLPERRRKLEQEAARLVRTRGRPRLRLQEPQIAHHRLDDRARGDQRNLRFEDLGADRGLRVGGSGDLQHLAVQRIDHQRRRGPILRLDLVPDQNRQGGAERGYGQNQAQAAAKHREDLVERDAVACLAWYRRRQEAQLAASFCGQQGGAPIGCLNHNNRNFAINK